MLEKLKRWDQLSLKPANRRVIILAVTAALATAGVSIYTLTRSPRSSDVDTPTVATPSSNANSVTALGRLEPQGEVVEVSGPTSERIGQLRVREGQQVQRGEVLAYLETYEERVAERDVAQSELAEARASLSAEANLGNAEVQRAESEIAQISAPQALEIQAQQATVAQLAAELEAEQKDLQRFQLLQREGAISQQALDDQTLAVRSKQQAWNNARATLAKLVQGRRTDLLNAQAKLEAAQANTERSQQQVQVQSAARKLELAETKIERTIIRAPKSGQVLKIFAQSGEAIAEEGILQLGNTQQMFVVAEVYETDISKVKVGQPATISSTALTKPLEGRVEQVGLQIRKNDVLNTDPAANTDARVVEVKIRLVDSRPVAGLTNLQVDVKIQPAATTL